MDQQRHLSKQGIQIAQVEEQLTKLRTVVDGLPDRNDIFSLGTRVTDLQQTMGQERTFQKAYQRVESMVASVAARIGEIEERVTENHKLVKSKLTGGREALHWPPASSEQRLAKVEQRVTLMER